MRDAERLILETAEADLDAGLEHVRLRLRDEVHGPLAFLARGIETAVMGGIAALELRPRMREDVKFLMELAHRVNAGEDPAKLAEDNIARAIRVRDLGFVVKTKDARFAPVLSRARDEMAKRLPDLARMVKVEHAKDYRDLVRQAFPDRAETERIVRENHDLMTWIFDHAEATPDLLRLPRSMVPRLAKLGRDVTAWQTARVLAGLDAIYAGPPAP